MAEEKETTNSGFTAGETRIVMCLIKHLKGDLPSDFDAVATELGYKDASIVKTRWGQIKRKKINVGGSGESGEKVTPRKRKGKPEGADGADDEETPKPKRQRKTKAQKAKEEEEEAAKVKKEEADDEAGAVESTEMDVDATGAVETKKNVEEDAADDEV